jgi:enoyl-CoA hydratase/carnithine racemase
MPFGLAHQTNRTFTPAGCDTDNPPMKFEDMIEDRSSHASGKMLQGRIGEVGVMLFNNPEKYNAISMDMWEGVAAILASFEADERVRVVIYAGTGDKAFVSGGDISQFEGQRNNALAEARFAQITGVGRQKLASFAKPSIACLQGYCLGGGMAIAMDADIRLASDNTRLGVPAARLGLAYGINPLARLVQLVGPSRAKMIMYTARRYSAEQALEMGLVDMVFPAADAAEQALAMAREIAANAPLSVLATKFTVDQLLREPGERDLDTVAGFTARCMDSEDYREGRTAFMEKRKPVFKGQ